MERLEGDLLNRIESIANCDVCAELAERGFESSPAELEKIAMAFLNHVTQSHRGEVLALLAERYLPIFAAKRALR